MPRHRNLNLQKFIDSIPSPLLEEYFERKIGSDFRVLISQIDYGTIKAYLDSPQDEDMKITIREDFTHINDICERNMNILVQSLDKYRIKIDREKERHELAMDIFLNHKDAYNYAYDYYSLFNSSSKMSEHNIEAIDFKITEDKLQRFKTKVKEFYSRQAKGEECIVRCYEEDDQVVFVIIHGSYKQSKTIWDEKDIKTVFFRPANEDILQYKKDSSAFSIKAPYKKDKENYIKAFTDEILCDTSQSDRPDRDQTYTLEPLQNGTLSFNGNEEIVSIVLLEIKLKMQGSTTPEIEIKSSDVLKTLEENFESISLNSGKLIHAKFLFGLEVAGKTKKITFEITPPNITDLTKKKHASIIGDYLKENGIKLID